MSLKAKKKKKRVYHNLDGTTSPLKDMSGAPQVLTKGQSRGRLIKHQAKEKETGKKTPYKAFDSSYRTDNQENSSPDYKKKVGVGGKLKLKKKKKKEKTDKVREIYYRKESGDIHTKKKTEKKGLVRDDNKGLVKGREGVITQTHFDNKGKWKNKPGSDTESKGSYKKVKVGPVEWERAVGKEKVGDVRGKDMHRSSQRTKFKILGKTVYDKDKDISNEKANKKYAKMKAKLLKRKKKK